MNEGQLARELPKGLIKWYSLKENSRALFIKGGIDLCDVLCEALEESGLTVDCAALEDIMSGRISEKGVYEYIVFAGVIERCSEPELFLQKLKDMMCAAGRLLIGADNRLGIRYFCGDQDVFTKRCFDSIENYTRISVRDREKMKGRAYSKAELVHMLEAAGFSKYRFYSVLPGLTRPQALYAEDYLPEEELDVRIAPQYYHPETVFLEEEGLYTSLIQNGMFHSMANGYLIECSLGGSFANMKQATISMDRGAENGLVTLIRRDGKVEKKPLYDEGQKKIEQLMEYTADLQKHGVKMVDARLESGSFVMPYIQGEPVTNYFRRLLCEDKELFLQEFDRFWELIKGSSEHVPYEEVDWENFDPAWRYEEGEGQRPARDYWRKIIFDNKEDRENMGIILDRGYLDLVSHNCFFVDGNFVFYDQEFYLRNLPANAILMRTIDFIYGDMTDDWNKNLGNGQMEAAMSRTQLQERYHLNKYHWLWHAFSDYFIYNLVNGKELTEYHKACRRDMKLLKANRYRMNYSEKEYRHFVNIFNDVENRKVYLFGSGAYAKHFIDKFGNKYNIDGILDNNSEKWGTEWNGIKVYSPEYLLPLSKGSYKVFICIQKCIPVMEQLEEMGIEDYSVYDSKREDL